MSFWSAWWRRRAAGVPDTARSAYGRADGDDRSESTGRQAAPEAVLTLLTQGVDAAMQAYNGKSFLPEQK